MEKRDELEKEERTIFIVLAIIVLIAIGVLLTWYFTKDKKAEDKDSDTKTKTIETKKKKEEETEENENVSYTVTTKEESNTPVVVLSSNVKANNEEVKIVDTAEVVETPATPTETTPVEEIVVHDSSKPFYFVGEKISFTGNIVSVTKISEQTVEGNYTIENNVISFSESGFYKIAIEGQEEPLQITVYSDKNELKGILNDLQNSVEGDAYYYGNDEYTKFNEEISDIMTNFDNYTFNEIREKLANFQSAYDALEQSMNTAQYTVDGIINEKISSIQGILDTNATITQEYENITIDIHNNDANIGSVIGVADSIINALQENKDTIDSVSCGQAKLTISDSLNDQELINFVKEILRALGIDDPSQQTTLGSLIGKNVDISVKLKDNDTEAKYHMTFTGTASANVTNIASISNDDIVLVDTATAQAVVETDIKNEETDEKVISNDIISEEEPSEEVTEPSTFVKEEEDGTGLVKEDQIQEPQALDPNLEVKETTLN